MKRHTVPNPSGEDVQHEVFEPSDNAPDCSFCPLTDEQAVAWFLVMQKRAACLRCLQRLKKLMTAAAKAVRKRP